MIQVLQLPDKHFKVIITNMLNILVEKAENMSEHTGNFIEKTRK